MKVRKKKTARSGRLLHCASPSSLPSPPALYVGWFAVRVEQRLESCQAKEYQGCKSRCHDIFITFEPVRPLEPDLAMRVSPVEAGVSLLLGRVQLSLLAQPGEAANSAFSNLPRIWETPDAACSGTPLKSCSA